MKLVSEVIFDIPRKPIEEVLTESAARIRDMKNVNELERRTLLAIIEGDPEADRLMKAIERRNALGLKLI